MPRGPVDLSVDAHECPQRICGERRAGTDPVQRGPSRLNVVRWHDDDASLVEEEAHRVVRTQVSGNDVDTTTAQH